MIHLFASIALVTIGLWIMRRAGRPRFSNKSTMQAHILNLERSNQILLQCTTDLKEARSTLLSKVILLEEGRALDILVAHDAIMREERAKAALLGVLKQNGCNDAQIAVVMDAVEGKTKEDV